MKVLLNALIVILLANVVVFPQVELSGFGQVKYEEEKFSVPTVRLSVSGPVAEGILNTHICYEAYVDFYANPDEIGFDPGYASIVIASQDVPVEVILGQTLDPTTYQFPAPFMLPTHKYPKASMNNPLALGVFARYSSGKIWAMVGYVNGDDELGIKRDITARVEYSLVDGLAIDAIYRGGNDNMNGRREYYGISLTYKSGPVWINGGRNYEDHLDNKISQWLWGTYDLTQQFQIVGLVETLETADATHHGWATGINISLSEETVARVGYQKRADESFEGWGIIFQQMF